jgi:hypothetical protein
VNQDPLDANLSPDDPHDDEKELTKKEKLKKKKKKKTRSVRFWSSFTTGSGTSSWNSISNCTFDAAVLIISPANAILLFMMDED